MKSNNFDILRLLAALLVIVGHAYPIMGYPQPQFLGTPISAYSVMIFFAISGYLVTGSWLSDPHAGRYFLRRSLRIFPALATVVILLAFVFGPIVSPLPASEYFANERTYNYLRNIGLYIIYDLPDVFSHNPIPHAVDGSLWSLPAEFFMYIVTPACILAFGKRSLTAFIVLTGFFASTAVYLGYFYEGPRPIIYATEVRATFAMASIFTAGGVLKMLGSKVSPNLKVAIMLGVVYVILAQFPQAWLRFPVSILMSFILSYIVISIGIRSTGTISNIGHRGDYSYGVYLYAFPIQQLIAELFPHMKVSLAIVLAIALTMPLAVLSWHIVEKNALRWKPRSRTRGVIGGQSSGGQLPQVAG